MKKTIFLLMATLFCLTLASSLEISPEYNTDTIVLDAENSIKLNLEITNASRGTYNLYTLADISIEPSQPFEIINGPFEKTFTISSKPNLEEGRYSFTYILNHRGVEKIEEKMLVNLMELEDVIEIGSDTISPSSNKIEFFVQNKESVNLKNLSAKFSSILFDTEETFDLDANEKLKISVEVDEDKLKKTKAGVYIIKSTFQTNSGEKRIDGNLYLGEKKGVASTEDKSGFLIRNEVITKINVGNVVETVQVNLERNIFSRLFTSFNIEPIFTDRHGFIIEYTWIKERLNPADTYTIEAKTNYLLPFMIILATVLALLGFRRFSETKLEIKKSVSHVKTKNDEFALKVTLALKAKKDVENVTIIDKVPAIVKIYKKFGTIKPDKIDAESRRIHWNIGDLNAGEERIFSYIIYSKVGVVGKFSLPEALAVFEKENKIHEINSNKVFFMSDQIRGN